MAGDDDMENGVPEGIGESRAPDGSVFRGNFRRGNPHGKGTHTSASGEVYNGEFLDGVKHGFGIWHHPSGDWYQGNWYCAYPYCGALIAALHVPYLLFFACQW